ncbi:MAG: tRNA pseudouridine(55) synthase TruB [Pseudomonadales bacterium]|nr:tRNA pseudouridine(55) synthase TruB [Pseudomonadales bacterium]
MARRKQRGRHVDGILLLDKPPGLTSNGALQQVKRFFSAAKAGHTGSLDPLATGVLPLCFGEATKFSQFLLEADKKYRTTIKLGIATKTGDSDGEIIEEKEVPLVAGVEAVLKQFRGAINQVPSMYSALKVNGQPLYKLARAGIEVERKERQVMIYELEIREQADTEWVLDIVCSKGTYIRTLAEDIGKVIGCGAHVYQLRRLKSGPYEIEETVTMEQLEQLKDDGYDALDRTLLPTCTAVQQWPSVELTDITASYFRQGQPVQVASSPTSGWVRIFNESRAQEESNFVGVGEILDDGRIAPRRLVVAH